MYSLKSMKLLIELLSNGNEDVQEQASYTIGYAVFGEDNMKDFRQARLARCSMFTRVTHFRRLGGVDSLLECFASPSKGVQQASSFAMSQAAFDFEVRREMRAKDGIRPLAKLLQSDDAKVVEQAMMAVANLALDVPTKQAIAVLGGMGFCAGLLSSSDVPVQANACLAGSAAFSLTSTCTAADARRSRPPGLRLQFGQRIQRQGRCFPPHRNIVLLRGYRGQMGSCSCRMRSKGRWQSPGRR
jgi:hypothetical protein